MSGTGITASFTIQSEATYHYHVQQFLVKHSSSVKERTVPHTLYSPIWLHMTFFYQAENSVEIVKILHKKEDSSSTASGAKQTHHKKLSTGIPVMAEAL